MQNQRILHFHKNNFFAPALLQDNHRNPWGIDSFLSDMNSAFYKRLSYKVTFNFYTILAVELLAAAAVQKEKLWIIYGVAL